MIAVGTGVGTAVGDADGDGKGVGTAVGVGVGVAVGCGKEPGKCGTCGTAGTDGTVVGNTAGWSVGSAWLKADAQLSNVNRTIQTQSASMADFPLMVPPIRPMAACHR